MMKNLIWFRNNLRTCDNHSLLQACQEPLDGVIAVYCFDPRHYQMGRFGFKKTERYRGRFLIETVHNLKKSLNALHIPLFVFHEEPETILPAFIQNHQIAQVFSQCEWTSEEQQVFDALREKVSRNVSFHTVFDQFLYHPNDLPYNDFSDIPEVFTPMRKRFEAKAAIRQTVPKPKPFREQNAIDNDTSIPTLHDLGLEDFELDFRSAFPFQGGEDAALLRLKNYLWETHNLSSYKKTRNGLIGRDYSSKLSAWLANGSISPRTVYREVRRFEDEVVKNTSTYWLIFELIWRDFFKYVSLKHGNKIFKIGGILAKDYDWGDNGAAREDWIAGATRYNFINANMKEIANTGFMSNRGRQNVASFWAKELHQDWRVGASYFESMLIDYDVHSNWGNWMYNSGVGNDPRDRKFNIERQAERYDAKGDYQRLWLQEGLF